MRWMGRLQGGILCCLLAAIPATSQDRSGRPGGQPGGGPGGRPGGPSGGGRPGGGSGERPQPQPQPTRPSPGGGGGERPQPQPTRPSPGGGGGERPNPGRPNPGGGRPNPGGGRPSPVRPNRPPQWGRPPQNRPSYHFRPNNRDFFRRYYLRNLGYINRIRRPIFSVGGYFPYGDIGYMTPVPVSLYGQIAPPPPGYQMGYFDGYVVVYDPSTYFIADLIDLIQ